MCKLGTTAGHERRLRTLVVGSIAREGRCLGDGPGRRRGLFVDVPGDGFARRGPPAPPKRKSAPTTPRLEIAGRDLLPLRRSPRVARLVRERGRRDEAHDPDEDRGEPRRRRTTSTHRLRWRSVRAPILARGRRPRGSGKSRGRRWRWRARRRVPMLQADALIDLATVLQQACKTDGGGSDAGAGARLVRRKGDVVSAARASAMRATMAAK